MTVEDFAEIAQNYSKETDSKAVFAAFKMLEEYQEEEKDDDFMEFPDNGNEFPSPLVRSRAIQKAYQRGAKILAALATIADNPVYIVYGPDDTMPIVDVEWEGKGFSVYPVFVSQEAAQTFLEGGKTGWSEEMAAEMRSYEVYRVPFVAFAWWGAAQYSKKCNYEPLYKIVDVDSDGEYVFCEITGRDYHNLIPTMALGAIDSEAAEAVLYGSENFSRPLNDEDSDEARKETN